MKICPFDSGKEVELDETLLPVVPVLFDDNGHVRNEQVRIFLNELATMRGEHDCVKFALQTIIEIQKRWIEATDKLDDIEEIIRREVGD